MPHTGNQSSSIEEADAVARLVNSIMAGGTSWTDRCGVEKPLTLDDILIITPYNAQVFEIQQRLPGARVGTVDKFQGQEAPIAIYSMATSSHADAPRGMEFLYSSNRFNVADLARAVCGDPGCLTRNLRSRMQDPPPDAARQCVLPVSRAGNDFEL